MAELLDTKWGSNGTWNDCPFNARDNGVSRFQNFRSFSGHRSPQEKKSHIKDHKLYKRILAGKIFGCPDA
jgi:hypothetical protein